MWSHFKLSIVLEGPLSMVVNVGASNWEMSVSIVYVVVDDEWNFSMTEAETVETSSSGSLSMIWNEEKAKHEWNKM